VDGNISLALLVLVGSLVLAFLGIATLVGGSTRRAELAARGRAGDPEGSSRRFARRLDARLRRTRSGQRLHAWLRGAGIQIAAIDFVGLVFAGTLLGWVLLGLVLPRGIALGAALAGAILAARWWVERERGKRKELLIAQLPDLARILSNGTQAGLSMAGAVQLAARELPDPAAAEMKTVVEEMRVGRALDESLESMRERLPSREVAVLMTTLIIQQRAGGDTVRALSELASTLDTRKDLQREIKTLLSGTVFTSYVVAALGVGTILLINAISPGVMREMTTTGIGIIGLIVAGILWTIAFVLIRRTTRVDV
jgi:tight adherence protein B